jgi:hypothetical protein
MLNVRLDHQAGLAHFHQQRVSVLACSLPFGALAQPFSDFLFRLVVLLVQFNPQTALT